MKYKFMNDYAVLAKFPPVNGKKDGYLEIPLNA